MKKIKFKPKKAAVKRFKVTKNNKIMTKSAFTSHLALSKKQKQKRHLRKDKLMDSSDYSRVKTLIAKR